MNMHRALTIVLGLLLLASPVLAGSTDTLITQASPSNAGSVTPSGTTDQSKGVPISISATASAGWAFSFWSQAGTAGSFSSSTDNPVTFTTPGGSGGTVTVTANFVTGYAISVASSPSAGGTASLSPSQAYYGAGTQIQITATPSAGYLFHNWVATTGTLTNALSATTTLTTAASACTLTASFVPGYALTTAVSPTTGGSVSVTPTQAIYAAGTPVQIVATPSTGYAFSNWVATSGTLANALSATTTLTIAGSACTLTANFTAIPYPVTVNQSTSGVVTLSPSTATYTYSQTGTLTATASPGFAFVSWSVTGGSVSPSASLTTLTVTSTCTVTASYTLIRYPVLVNQVTGGNVTLSPSTATYTYNQTGTLTATPAAGYTFAGWAVTGGSVSPSTSLTTLTVTSTCTVTPSYTLQSWAESVTAPTGGTISGITDGGTYSYGQSMTITATAATGYRFSSWSLTPNGGTSSTLTSSSTSQTVLTVYDNFTLAANFTAIIYTVSASPSPKAGGTVSVGSTTGTLGQTISVTGTYQQALAISATPSSGYAFTNWTATNSAGTNVNGTVLASASTVNSNTLNLSTFSVTLTANFTAITYTGTLTQTTGGTVGVSTLTATYGQVVTLSQTTNPGYTFQGYLVTGGTLSNSLLTITNSWTVTGSYSVNSYNISTSNPAGGTVNVNGAGSTTASYNQVITLTQTPNAGYTFDNYYISSGSGSVTGSLLTVLGNGTVTGSYTLQSWAETVTTPTGGTISGITNGGTYSYGQVLNISAAAQTGYVFSGWILNPNGGTPSTLTSSSTSQTTLTVYDNFTLTAGFTAITYTGTLTQPAGGTVGVSSLTATYNQVITLTQTTNPGYTFQNYVYTGGSLSGSRLTITNSWTVTASYSVNTYTVSGRPSPKAGGAVSIGSTTGTLGQTISLTATYQQALAISATPSTGYAFSNWTATNTAGTNVTATVLASDSTVNSNTLTVPTYSVTLTANFAAITYTGTLTQPTGGTVGASSLTATYNQVITLSQTTNPGYTFQGYLVTGGTLSTNHLTVTNSWTVTGSYSVNSYNISTANPAGGTVNVNGAGSATASYNQVLTLTQTPNAGYTFDNYYISSGLGALSGSLLTVTGSATVTASYTLQSWAETVTAPTGGSISGITNGGTYNYGQVLNISAAAQTGYAFSGWNLNGGSVSQLGSASNSQTTLTVKDSFTLAVTFTAITYTVSAAPSPVAGGAVSVGSTTGTLGQTISVTGTYHQTLAIAATAEPGYAFCNWTATNSAGTNVNSTVLTSASTVNSNTLTLPAYSVTLTANFALIPYPVTVNQETGGTVTLSPNTATYTYGESGTLTATASAGYTFDSWAVTGGSVDSTSSSQATLTVTSTCTVTPSYTLESWTETVTAPANGSISGVTDGGTYSYGQPLTITATATTGYQFAGWTLTVNGGTATTLTSTSNSQTTLTVYDNFTLTASFTAISYNVTGAASPTDGGSVGLSSATGTICQVISLSQTTNPGYIFTGWTTVGGTLAGNLLTLGAGNAAVTANYLLIPYPVFVNQATGGTVTLDPNQDTYTYNELGSLTASADSGYVFDSWDVTGGVVGPSASQATLAVTSTCTVSAVFTQLNYTVAVTQPSAGGTISGGDGSYHWGDSVTVNLSVDSGYTFTSWAVGNATITDSSATSCTFTVQGAPTVTAILTQNSYTGAQQSAGGTIAFSDSGPYIYGQQITVTATALAGFQFSGWSVTGLSTLSDSTAATTSLTVFDDFDLTANFTPITYNVTIAAIPSSGGTVAVDSATGTIGQTISISQTTNPGYTFAGWTLDDGNNGAAFDSTSANVILGTADVTISANYTQNGYNITVVSAQGTVTLTPSVGPYVYLQTVAIAATANPGYTFTGFTVDDGGNGAAVSPDNTTLTVGLADLTLTANYSQIDYSSTLTQANGSITIPAGPYTYGQTYAVTATPDAGFQFSGWTVTGLSTLSDSTAASTSLTVFDNFDLTANFTAITYGVTIAAVPASGGTVAVDSATGTIGQAISISQTTNPGYTFTGFTLDDGNNGAAFDSTSANVILGAASVSISANYTQNGYNITVVSAQGTVTLTPSVGPYVYQQSVALSVTPNAGYTFTGFTVDDGGNGAAVTPDNTTLTVGLADLTLTANFTAITYNVAIAAVPSIGGAVAVGSATGTIGQAISISQTTNPGYTFTGWTLDDGNNGAAFDSTSANVILGAASVTISANFSENSYSGTEAETGGTIILSNSGPYTYGQVITVTAVPQSNYAFSGWNLTGVSVLSDSTAVTTSLTVYDDFTLTAIFTQETFTVTAWTSNTWVYQNAPASTRDRHVLTLTVSVTADTWGNSAYTTTVTQSGDGVVTPTALWTCGTLVTPTPSATWTGLSGYLVGGRVNGLVTSPGNLALTGSCTVHVVVTGNVGGVASTDLTILVRPLGDINSSGQVDRSDLAILNARLNALSIAPQTNADCDLSGDGAATTADRVLLNRVLDGLLVP